MGIAAPEQPRYSVDVDAATTSGTSMAASGEDSRGTSLPSRPTTGPSRFGKTSAKHTTTATQGSTAPEGEALTAASVCGSAFTARLWQWAQKASWDAGPKGGRRLKEITLEHILAGETCGPISLSDFENFLAHCDYSLENLQFVVWYLDYRARFDALSDEQRKHSPPPSRAQPQRFSSLPKPSDSTVAEPINIVKKRKLSINTSAFASSSSGSSSMSYPPPPLPLPTLTPVTSNTSGVAPPTPTSPAPAYSVSDPRCTSATVLGSSPAGPELDFQGFYAYAYDSSSFVLTGTGSNCDSVPPLAPTPTTAHPFLDSIQARLPASPRAPSTPQPPAPAHPHAELQPFRAEVQRVLATFVLPGSRKELLLDSEERDLAIAEARWTTHPDVFAPLHATCLTHLRLVSLPRFLLNSATNVNRPKQIFWYFFGLLDVAIGIVLALLVVLCPLDRWMVTPGRASTHRVWRLMGLPLFWLGSMQWFAAYRGFCSQVFMRGTTQLRAWEMDTLEGEVRPSDELENEDGEDGEDRVAERKRKKELTRSSSLTNGTRRIAPFLDVEPYSSASSSSPSARDKSADSNDASRPSTSKNPGQNSVAPSGPGGRNSSRPKTAWSRRRRRPPIFGPERIVEDETIRAVHAQVWRDLLRFGAVWAVAYVAVVVSVPSLRVGPYQVK